MSSDKLNNTVVYTKVETTENEKKDLAESPPSYGYGFRHIQGLIMFMVISTAFFARGHLGMTIVAMTYLPRVRENITLFNGTDFNETHSLGSDNRSTSIGAIIGEGETDEYFPKYVWSKSIQEMALGSFFLGYCITMFPMSMVCQRWGGKIPVQISLGVNGIISLLTPWLVKWGGWKALCGCRIAQGLTQAGTFPGTVTLLAKWVPLNERGSFNGFVHTGSNLGMILAFQLSGLLGSSSWGWPSIFWMTGIICLAAFFVATFFGAATPQEHKYITEEEKSFILGHMNTGEVKNTKRAPLKKIMLSRPVWATFATQIGSSVAYLFFFTQVPSYLHYILDVDVKNSGVLSSLPYVGSLFMCVLIGVVSDYLINKKVVTVKQARVVCNSISQILITIATISISYTKTTTLAVTFLVLNMTFFMGISGGWMANQIDLTPNYSGTLMAIGATFVNIATLCLPIFTSNIITDVTNQHQWRIMFFAMAGVAFITNAIFVAFMSTEKQPWNDDVDEQEDSEKPRNEKEQLAKLSN